MLAFNAEFMQPAQEERLAFVAWIGVELDGLFCQHYERVLPVNRHRRHDVKVMVRVHRHVDGSLAIFHVRSA